MTGFSPLLHGMALVFGLSGAVCALAQGYPYKPIRLIVGYSAGGGTDVIARIVGLRLSEVLGQPIVVDNRPAAAGAAAAGLVARSPADGYTLFVAATSTLAVNPSLYKDLPYDTGKDFTPVAQIVAMPNLLVVTPGLPVASVAELIALAKAERGRLTYASGGVGSSNHFTAELFNYMAGVKMTHIPYKGGGPAMVDVASGQVAIFFSTIASAMPQVKSGRLRSLAVTSATRSQSLPEVPTIAEAGLPGYESTIWYGALLPARAPQGIVERLNFEIVKILKTPEIRQRFLALGADTVITTPEQFAQYIQSEIKKWDKVVKDAGIRAE
ncbi:MAG: tripartite tricarboxylate transporter substrate binding protein [Betaproteobacteria bacterium]|nr:tripartite tricarboxylate transporter substrate binding protein [Betaproteobacteria bacterium]